VSITRDLFKGLKKKLTRQQKVEWTDRETTESMILRIPNKTTPDPRKISGFTVQQGERVALFQKGSFHSLLTPGSHEVNDEFDQAYYVDVTEKTQQIGIRAPEYPITSDGQSFGFSGNIVFRVMSDQVSVGSFITRLVDEQEQYEPVQLSMWLRDGLLFQVFKEIIKDHTYEEFRSLERLDLLMEIESRLGFELRDYGVEVVSLELKYFTPSKQY